MKIHVFVDEFPPFFRGGLGTYAMEVSRRLAERNDVTVFTRGNKPDFESDCYFGAKVVRAPLLKPDCYPAILPPHVRQWGEGRRFYAETLFYNIFSAYRATLEGADVIASHDWLSFLAGVLASKNAGGKLVTHFHSTEYGRISSPSPDVCEIEREGIEKAERVITVSYAMKDEITKFYGNAEKVEVVYNGVDAEKYNPERFDKREVESFREKFCKDEKVVLFLGRLTWVKGIDSLVKAMPEIERLSGKTKLVVVGKGEMEDYVRNLVKELNVNAYLRFEYISERERILHYLSSDVVVVPSRYEPFGIVCTEAMALERAVVVGARGTSGLREQVVSGECGYHINPDDPHDIAVYTSKLLNDEELREQMGKNARKRVLSLFTWDNCVEKTERIYSEVVAL